MPVYNLARYVTTTFKSISAQLMGEFAVIVVDDGSTDDTLAIARQYATLDDRFTVLQRDKAGVSVARNAGLELVDTEYFTFVDGDDILSTHYLSELLDVARKTNADVTCGRIKKIRRTTDAKQNSHEHGKVSVIDNVTAIHELLYSKSIDNAVYAKLYKTAKFGNLRFDETLRVGEDIEYVYNVLRRAQSVAISTRVVYYYLLRIGSTIHSEFTYKHLDARVAIHKLTARGDMSTSEARATQAKLFVTTIAILAKMRLSDQNHPTIRNELLVQARRQAPIVARDNSARLVHRVYAVLVIINPSIVISLAVARRRLS